MRPDLPALRAGFHGTVLSPYDPGYEEARVLFNTRVRTRPVVLCRCAGTGDVAAAVRFAREAGPPSWCAAAATMPAGSAWPRAGGH